MTSIVVVILSTLLLSGTAGLGFAARAALSRLDATPRQDDTAHEAVIALGLGICSLSVVSLLLGVSGALTPPVLLILLTVSSFGWIVAPRPPRLWPAHVDLLDIMTVVLIGLLAAIQLVRALCPATAWDALAYHLALGKIFAANANFGDVATIRMGRWPLALDALFAVSESLFGDALSGVVAWSIGVVATLAVAALGATVAGPRAAIVAAGLFVGAPVTAYLQGVAYVDAGLAGLVALALVATFRYAESRRPSALLTAGIFAGTAAAVKYTALLYPPLIALVAVGMTRRWRCGANLLLVAGFAAMPWYLRTCAVAGNPIWPYGFALLGGRDWSVAHSHLLAEFERGYGPGTSLRDAILLPWRLVFRPDLFDRLPLGPAFLALVPFAFWRRSRDTRLLLAFSLLAAIGWFETTQQIRFLVPILPAVAVAIAAGVASADRRSVALIARLVVVAVAASTLVLSLAGLPDRLAVLTGTETVDDYLSRSLSHHRAVQFINQTLRPRRLLLVREVRGYYLDVPYLWGDPLNQAVIDYPQLADADALRRRLDDLGVDAVLINDNEFRGGYYDRRTIDLIEATVTAYGHPVWNRDGVRVVQLDRTAQLPERP